MVTYTSTGNTVSYVDAKITSKHFVLSQIDSSQTYKQKYLSQRWNIEVNSPPVLRSEAFTVMSQWANNRVGTITLPTLSNTSGTASGTITTQLISSVLPEYNFIKGSTKIAVDGSATGTLKKGDFVKFSNHSKVYQLTDDVNLDGSSVNVMNIFPALFVNLTSNTIVAYNNVSLNVSLIGTQVEIKTDLNGYYTYNLQLQEEY